VRRTLL